MVLVSLSGQGGTTSPPTVIPLKSVHVGTKDVSVYSHREAVAPVPEVLTVTVCESVPGSDDVIVLKAVGVGGDMDGEPVGIEMVSESRDVAELENVFVTVFFETVRVSFSEAVAV